MKQYLLAILIVILLYPTVALKAADPVSVVSRDSYPRLANYYLKWSLTDADAKQLAKWNVVVLDMENQENSPDQIKEIRRLNPHIIILAYITSEEILNNVQNYNNAFLRQELAQGVYSGWWLLNTSGQKVSNWPGTSMLNLSDGAIFNASRQRFNDYLPQFVVDKLEPSGLWDGVFYDNTWGTVSWISDKNLDLNNDGQSDNPTADDQAWAKGFKKMLKKTRQLAGPNFIIVGNGQVYWGYQSLLNGMMLEDFPSPWENGGTWSGSMETYNKLSTLNPDPQVSIVNIYNKNQADYQRVRFGLTSTLLGNGFFSYDYDVSSPGQIWWYDEYSVKLGYPQSAPYNLLDNNSQTWQPGLWRRDFTNGITLVNSTNKKQVYVFNHEEFEKIQGTQDPKVNNGQNINYVILQPKDGLVLYKRNQSVFDSPFVNGYFYRVYDASGQQPQNGFFAYNKAYPGDAAVILDGANISASLNVVAAAGRVSVYKQGKLTTNWSPYGANYKRGVNLDGSNLSDGSAEVVTGAGFGGGPLVSVFSGSGKLQYRFFAYNQKLRSGVNVAMGDLNNNGRLKIVTAPGPGSPPLVKIFDLSGHLETSFMAYDSRFLGGVNVAVGDLNNDKQLEIVTTPASAGGPQVRIFNAQGKVLGSFFAYDQSYHGGVKVSLSDINGDGNDEILTGLKNFY